MTEKKLNQDLDVSRMDVGDNPDIKRLINSILDERHPSYMEIEDLIVNRRPVMKIPDPKAISLSFGRMLSERTPESITQAANKLIQRGRPHSVARALDSRLDVMLLVRWGRMDARESLRAAYLKKFKTPSEKRKQAALINKGGRSSPLYKQECILRELATLLKQRVSRVIRAFLDASLDWKSVGIDVHQVKAACASCEIDSKNKAARIVLRVARRLLEPLKSATFAKRQESEDNSATEQKSVPKPIGLPKFRRVSRSRSQTLWAAACKIQGDFDNSELRERAEINNKQLSSVISHWLTGACEEGGLIITHDSPTRRRYKVNDDYRTQWSQ